MFDSVYDVTKVNVNRSLPNEGHLRRTLYRFKTKSGERYLIFVTEFSERFHTIDFCRTSQQYSKHQFTELTGKDDAIRIISTVVRQMITLLEEGYEEAVCFGFIGARSKNEKGKSSKRFRIYRMIMQNLVDRVKYIHLEDESLDAYVILNKNADSKKVLEIARNAFEKEEE
jgi:hypothetical protein